MSLTILKRCVYENGATQIIVGSHKWPEADQLGPADRSLCSTAEMDKGDERFDGGENRRTKGCVELERRPWVILRQHIQMSRY